MLFFFDYFVAVDAAAFVFHVYAIQLAMIFTPPRCRHTPAHTPLLPLLMSPPSLLMPMPLIVAYYAAAAADTFFAA